MDSVKGWVGLGCEAAASVGTGAGGGRGARPPPTAPCPALTLVPSEAAARILRRFRVLRSKIVMVALSPRSARASRRCRWHTAKPVMAASGLPATKR